MAKKTFLSLYEQTQDELRQRMLNRCMPTDVRKILTFISRYLSEVQFKMETRGKLTSLEKQFIKSMHFCIWWMPEHVSPLAGELPLAAYIEKEGGDSIPIDVEVYI